MAKIFVPLVLLAMACGINLCSGGQQVDTGKTPTTEFTSPKDIEYEYQTPQQLQKIPFEDQYFDVKYDHGSVADYRDYSPPIIPQYDTTVTINNLPSRPVVSKGKSPNTWNIALDWLPSYTSGYPQQLRRLPLSPSARMINGRMIMPLYSQ